MKDKSSIISSYITNPLSYIIVYLSKYTLRLSKATKQLLSNNNNTMCYLQSLSESVNFKSSSIKLIFPENSPASSISASSKALACSLVSCISS